MGHCRCAGSVDLVYRVLPELREIRVAPVLFKRLAEVIAGLKGSDVSVLIVQSELNHSRRVVDSEIVIERGANVERAAA